MSNVTAPCNIRQKNPASYLLKLRYITHMKDHLLKPVREAKETRSICMFTLQHTATHCNTLQHTATHCNTLQHTAPSCKKLCARSERLDQSVPSCRTYACVIWHVAMSHTTRVNASCHTYEVSWKGKPVRKAEETQPVRVFISWYYIEFVSLRLYGVRGNFDISDRAELATSPHLHITHMYASGETYGWAM